MKKRKRITFSRNYTISLSRTCQCYCKYCSFVTHKAHLYTPDQVTAQLDEAVKRGSKELLILTGEKPEVNAEVKRRLAEYGHGDFVSYVVWVCQQALERGVLPHSNIGAVSRDDLIRLREVNASIGLMLESVSERLMDTVHAGSPTKHPRVRLETIEAAGRLKTPFTSGILVGIGESWDERVDSLKALANLHGQYGHIQEIIIQNYVPHQKYYGRDVGELADRAAQGQLDPASAVEMPEWGSQVSLEEIVALVEECRKLMPDVGVQVPPNLSDWWLPLVEAGITDLGGLSSNGDHISPEHPFPTPHKMRRSLQSKGYALSERLCVYPKYIEPQWIDQAVLDVIKVKYWSFIPKQWSASSRRLPLDPYLAERALRAARADRPLNEAEVTALFYEQRPQMVEEIRVAADELRHDLVGDTVTYVVNRNINFTNICIVGCAFCGFGQSQRSPDARLATADEFVGKVREAVDYGATELCMQGGIHPDYQLEDYGGWLKLAKEVAPQIHLHAYSPMEIDWMCERSGKSPEAVFEYLIECGLGSTPGTAAEVLHDGVRQRISPNKLPVGRWLEIIEAAHRSGLPTTATVMFGHIEQPWELAQHMRLIRELQEKTQGITEFVPLSFIPFQTLLGRTQGIEEISREENLKYTAVFRLALGRSIKNLQASWVKMGIDAATESLSWGVNDLGGTLMEESISRMAGSYHGIKLDPDQLVAAAHAAGRPAVQRDTLYRQLAPKAPTKTTVAEHPLEDANKALAQLKT